ncbi:hypothetical protein FRC17_004521 [Serendipita sp. 399]|nr:hypothetical protein FRC17_004521 [Serendipita sp. 399]
MALTSTQSKATVTRSTRIKRVSNEATTKDVPSMTGTSNAAGRRQPRALANNEKENINPLTGLDSFQSSKMSKQNSVFAVSGKTNATPKGTTEESAKGRAGLITRSRSIPSAQNDSDFPARPRPRKSTTSHAKNTLATDKTDDNSGGLQSVIDALLSRHAPGLEERLEDTMAGRHLAARQLEAPSDQYARELTVKPLADLSEAFSVPSSLADLVTHNAPSAVLEPHDSVVHEVDADDLNATLRLLLASADDRVRLPTVLRTRGTKRNKKLINVH